VLDYGDSDVVGIVEKLPGGRLNALAPVATPQGHNLQVDIVYGVDYQGI